MLRGMRNGNVRRRRSRSFIQFARATMEEDDWCAGFFGSNFDILPTDATAPAGLQSFQRRFFCRKARGIMLCGRCATRFTVRAFGRSEYTFSKTRCARDGLSDAPHFDDVDADGNDHRRGRC